jgi:hypothetical protein
MSVLKAFFKLMILLFVGAAIVGVVAMVKQPKLAGSVSYEEWPDVPRNPAA